MLRLKNLTATIEGKEILHDLSFDFAPNKTYALMGPNGSGKSTLAHAVMGRPDVTYSQRAKILFGAKNIKNLSPDKRAALGVFMSFQNPLPLPGVTVFDLLRLALEKKIDPVLLHQRIQEYAEELHIKEELLKRSLNVGFSGGEKKKLEALQAALLAPTVAFFDELDTGVDVDALKLIATFLKKHLPQGASTIFITHSTRILRALKPDEVLVLVDGHITKRGSGALAKEIEKKGFTALK